MAMSSVARMSSRMIVAALLALSAMAVTGGAAHADTPSPVVNAPFSAPRCPGTTDYDPTDNGNAVPDTTQVFGKRLDAYNAGKIVALYDAYGGTILLDAGGAAAGDSAYPPLCGTRYVASAGGPTSEWMFCTDRHAQSCGDTDAVGNLVSEDGKPINPMERQSANSRLDAFQAGVITYLIQHGHDYAGIGNQVWGGVAQARADAGSAERSALQTLIWCVSDPASDGSDFQQTCEASMPEGEQKRIFALLPPVPQVTVKAAPGSTALKVGQSARFRVTTTVVGKPISVTTGGSAKASWSVCSGSAALSGTTLTVTAKASSSPVDVVVCARATTTGTALLRLSVQSEPTFRLGWAQSVNPALAPPCQVYALPEGIAPTTISAAAQAAFTTPADAATPTGRPTAGPDGPASATPSLPATGGTNLALVWLGLGMITVGEIALVVART